jgi:hypothetical protein
VLIHILHSAYIRYTQSGSNTFPWLNIVTRTALKWSKEGWGGHIRVNFTFGTLLLCAMLTHFHQATSLINVNPRLTLDEAKASLKNISDYALSQNGSVTIETLPSWKAFFDKYVTAAEAVSDFLLADSTPHH